MAEPGQVLELEVGSVAHGGIFVARYDGRVVFVTDTLPGERVRARLTETKHDRFWRADTIEVLDAAPERQAHVWDAASIDRDPAERAGGAEFGHIALERQRALKSQVLGESLARMGGVERDVAVEAVPTIDAPDDQTGTGWRTRVRLQVDADGRPGPYAARSHHVVDIDDLPLATERVREAAPLRSRFAGAAHVDVIAPSAGEAIVLVAESDRRGRPLPYERGTVSESVAGRTFSLERGGFWQVHSGAAETLYRAVQDAIDPALFDPRAANLDLYGGVGLLAAAVGDRFGDTVRITTVESDPLATDHAAQNLSEWIGARAVTARVDRYVRELQAAGNHSERARTRSATVVLDPPRSGAGREVIDALAALAPRQLVYVACDPVALARDVGFLRAHGYELADIRAFDLFPNTHHVEAVARLVDTR
ncbi:class I SAM-dependent RNA methyltransferase [Agromyces atrinae]|uniref:Class I SAM-dependent RNA methyltransferase n=1 Tax=Agromyces atrinae TaxID=592376 RepID=A0A4Q2MBE3_9MICO|nr:TRAM domain-containing protein [Agromyces atrinae]NYD66731.1 tRNA/tmRNA/rRNA uracil-C5-methylase (TrmA/RlmC/RlmD family) [Agromyces atrinae]RXZ87391.1 class I SAM-dependent RNA methyltransferase [Agromyces atrinae]